MTGTGGVGRPTKKEGEARTQSLLDAARALFCEKGFAGATIDEIALRVRCSKHTIYRRYPTKLALLEAVVDRDIGQFRSVLENAGRSEQQPLERLRAVGHAYFEFSASSTYSALYSAIVVAAATSPELRGVMRQWPAVALLPLAREVQAAAQQEGWAAERADEIVEFIIDLLDGAAHRVKWSDPSPGDKNGAFDHRWAMVAAALPHLFASSGC